MSVGEIIRNARKAKGLTQQELGEIVGVQKSAIAKYETGRVINIKRSTMQKLATALELRGSDLIVEETAEELATFHAKVLSDGEVMMMVRQYYDLTAKQKKAVRDLIDSFSE